MSGPPLSGPERGRSTLNAVLSGDLNSYDPFCGARDRWAVAQLQVGGCEVLDGIAMKGQIAEWG